MRRSAVSRLQKRGDNYYFRAAVPNKWLSVVKRREIKFSLVTSDRATAILRCRVLSNAFDIFFRGDVLSKIPLARIEDAARTYFTQQLNKAFELSLDIPGDLELDTDFEIACLRDRISALGQMLKSLQFDHAVKNGATEILGLIGDGRGDADDLIYARKLAARSEIQSSTFLAHELSGGVYDNSTADPVFRGVSPTALPMAHEGPPSANLTLAGAIENYILLKKVGWVGKTLADQERSLHFAQDVIGSSRSISTVGAEDMRNIRDILLKVPKNGLKSKANAQKTLLQLANSEHKGEHLSTKTMDKYFSMIRAFFRWAVDEEFLPSFPGPNIKLPNGTKISAISERSPYSTSQLSTLFLSPLYKGYVSHARRTEQGNVLDRDGYYWVPIVALYSGLRLGEIVQLRTSDLKVSDGIPYFDISVAEGEDDKSLKTEGSKRCVPVHPILLSLGLLDYQKGIRSSDARLFADIKPDAKGYYSGNFSKWWGRRTKMIGIHSKKTVFHSFRHNFIDALRDAEVPEDIIRALSGHADVGDRRDTHLRYGSRTSLRRLRDGIAKVAYPGIDSILISRD